MVKYLQSRHLRIGSACGVTLLILLMLWSPALAQLTRGTIAGVVTDQSGAAIPGFEVTITHVETGVSRTTINGETGRYEAPNLAVGDYEVTHRRGQFVWPNIRNVSNA